MTQHNKLVQTRYPPEWADDAEDMDVTITEFIRRMVRAGRCQYGYDHVEEPDEPHLRLDTDGQGTLDIDEVVREFVRRNLATDDGLTEEELADLVAQNLEESIVEQLEVLKAEGVVDYEPIAGGWVKQ